MTPGTGCPLASSTANTTGAGSVASRTPVCPSPSTTRSESAASSGVVAVAVARADTSAAVAARTCLPKEAPKVQEVCARPSGSVVAERGSARPLRRLGEKDTSTPGTGCPSAPSSTTTTGAGSVASRTPVCPSPSTTRSESAASSGVTAVAVTCADTSAAVAVRACAPKEAPRVQEVCVRPSASVVAERGSARPLRRLGEKDTSTPGTGCPWASSAANTTGAGSVASRTPLCPSPCTTRSSSVASSGVSAVAESWTDGPPPPATEATRLCTPARSPSVHDVAARPSASVATVSEPAAPSPRAGANATRTPGTGSPRPSSASTTKASRNARPWSPVCPPPSTTRSESVASSGVSAVAESWTDGPPPTATEATKLCTPARSPSVHDVAARPSASVATVSEPAAPSPRAGANATRTPGTGSPRPSSASTTKASRNARPWSPVCPPPSTTRSESVASSGVSAVAESWTDGPPPTATEATKLCTPARSPSVHDVAARPSASVAAVAGAAVPFPSAGAKTIVTPSIGEPPASSARTTTSAGSASPWRTACSAPDTTLTVAGSCATVTPAVALRSSNDAVSIPDPLATASTTPPSVTVNTAGRLLLHRTAPANAAPYWSVIEAVTTAVSPSDANVTDEGAMASDTGRGGAGPSSHEASATTAVQANSHRRQQRRSVSRPMPT